MKIQTSTNEAFVVIHVEGSLSSEEKIAFEKEINKHIEKKVHCILDLSKVSFIDSTALGSIVKYNMLFEKKNKYLLLASLNQQIYEVFNITGITKQIKIFESLQKAIDFTRES